MLNLRYNMYPDFSKYADYISEKGFIYMSKSECELEMYKLSQRFNVTNRILKEYMTCENPGKEVYNIDQDTVKYFLTVTCGVPEERLTKKGVKGLSLDQTEVLIPLKQDGYAVEFLCMYMRWKEIKTLKERLARMIDSQLVEPKTPVTDNTGFNLSEVHYTYEEKGTGRYYTKDYNIQNIPKYLNKTIKADKDYCLLWCDLDQIDLRVAYNLYLREPGSEDDKIFNSTPDKYEALYRIIYAHLDKEFNQEEFKKNRPKFKEIILARIYNASKYTLYKRVPDWKLINELDKYFKENKRYQHMITELNKTIEFNMEIDTEDYFGRHRKFGVNPDDREGSIDKALNSPVQSTSNSIIVHIVNSIMDRFRYLGFNSDKVSVYMIRHDEFVLKIHKSALPYAWVVEDYRTIKVDDWEPLTSDYHLGFSYSVEDEQLMTIYEKYKEKNIESITPEASNKVRGGSYYIPIKRVANLSLCTSNTHLGFNLNLGGTKRIFLYKSLKGLTYKDIYRECMPIICTNLQNLGFNCVNVWDIAEIGKDFSYTQNQYKGLEQSPKTPAMVRGVHKFQNSSDLTMGRQYLKDLSEGEDIEFNYGNVIAVDLDTDEINCNLLQQGLANDTDDTDDIQMTSDGTQSTCPLKDPTQKVDFYSLAFEEVIQ